MVELYCTDLDVNAITGLPSNLEFFVVSIRFLNRKICLGIFYRPPSSPSSIFDTFLQSLEASVLYFCLCR